MNCNHFCLKAGKILFAIPFLVFGVFHFMSASTIAGMLAGWPGATFLVYVSGLGMIFAAVSLLTGKYVHLAMKLLALELLIFVLSIHLPAVMAGGAGAQMAIGSMLKDVALMAGALVIASVSGSCGKGASCGGDCKGCTGCEGKKDEACCAIDHSEHKA